MADFINIDAPDLDKALDAITEATNRLELPANLDLPQVMTAANFPESGQLIAALGEYSGTQHDNYTAINTWITNLLASLRSVANEHRVLDHQGEQDIQRLINGFGGH